MIQPQELRIGNCLYYKVLPHAPESYKIIEVTSISKNGFISFINDDGKEETYYLDNFEKIPITEEIILKCGFENYDNEKYNPNDKYAKQFEYHLDSGISYRELLCKPYYGWIIKMGTYDDKLEIKYVHQLQNLYYELKDEELTFK